MDSLLMQMNSILAEYTSNIDQTMLDVMNQTAREGAKQLKATSPKARGKYANSWAVKKMNGKFIIYNKKPGLTHLLENGHDVVVNGVKVGRASAHPHIKDVNDWVSKTVVERLEQLL